MIETNGENHKENDECKLSFTKNRVYKSQTNKYIILVKTKNLIKKENNMKNYNEILNDETINEVNSIMNTVSEEKLNEIRKKWDIFYEMFHEYGDIVNDCSCFDEISEDGYDMNYIMDNYDEQFESDLLVYDSVFDDKSLDTMYIMFDKNNKFYLINREKEEVYFIK